MTSASTKRTKGVVSRTGAKRAAIAASGGAIGGLTALQFQENHITSIWRIWLGCAKHALREGLLNTAKEFTFKALEYAEAYDDQDSIRLANCTLAVLASKDGEHEAAVCTPCVTSSALLRRFKYS